LQYSDNDHPLDGNPPAYAELFRFTRARIEDPEIKPEPGDLKPEKRASPLPSEQNGAQPLVKLAKTSSLIAEALGISDEETPRVKYSKEDAHRFAAYVEKNSDYFKAHLPEDPDARQAILGDVEKMMLGSIEPRRRDVLLRWFRDPAAPANVNPMKLIDPKEKAEGNLLQLVHPLVFNAILLVVSIPTVVLIFAFMFRGGK